MQNNNVKASILIWATFLSLIISVSFISISTKINKNLKNNNNFNQQIEINNQIQNIINTWKKNWNYINQTLDNWDNIIFDAPNEHEISLKKLEKYIIKINENSNITIEVLVWWPINTSSWIITTTKTISNLIWDYKIENYWWFTQIKITSSSTKNYLSKYTNYKIIKKLWNKEIISLKWKIKNF